MKHLCLMILLMSINRKQLTFLVYYIEATVKELVCASPTKEDTKGTGQVLASTIDLPHFYMPLESTHTPPKPPL